MKNPWQLYDDLIDLVPAGVTVKDAAVGDWAYVETEIGCGMAMAYQGGPPVSIEDRDVCGKDLKDVAAMVKLWDLQAASLGTAALTAALNTVERVSAYPTADSGEGSSSFEVHESNFRKRKVATVGHFRRIEQFMEGNDFFVLERNPVGDDLPDAACEYVLADRDDVFITGSTLTNKTLPRLLELSAHARVVLVGPSVPFAPEVFSPWVAEIGGSIVTDPKVVKRAVSFGGGILDSRNGVKQFNSLIRTSTT